MTGRHRGAGAARAAGRVGLGRRQISADPWASVMLAALIALMSCLATLLPRFAEDVNTRQIAHVLSALSPDRRDVSTIHTDTLTPLPPATYTTGAVTWIDYFRGMDQLSRKLPEPLRSAVGDGEFTVDVGPLSEGPPPGASSDLVTVRLQPRVDPFLLKYAQLAEGSWPQVVFPRAPNPGDPVLPETDDTPQVVVEQASAERMGWRIGETYQGLRLTGTFQKTDPEATHWAHSPLSTMSVFYDGNSGNKGTIAAYLAEANPGTTHGVAETVAVNLWYPLLPDQVRGNQVATLAAQLNGLATKGSTLIQEGEVETPDGFWVPVPAVNVKFSSDSVSALQSLALAQSATAAIVAVVAAGPLGVMLATTLLGARLIVTRRRPALALATARGGSPLQIRGLLALEGMLLGLPAAAVGYLVAGRFLPTATSRSELVVAALFGMAPAVALALASGARSLRETRSDLALHSRSTLRWSVELVVVVLAALAAKRLLDRGLTGVAFDERAAASAAGASNRAAGRTVVDAAVTVDLLLAATPVLLALAACVLTLRLYPLPVAALTAVLRRRTSLTPFLGAARSVRDPSGGAVPALAVVLGVAIAVISTVLATTITTGAERAAWTQTGADIRLSGPRIDQGLLDRLAAVDGVESVGTITRVNAKSVVHLPGEPERSVTIYLVDPAVPAIQATSPLIDAIPDEIFDQRTPPGVLAGGSTLTVDAGAATMREIGPVEIAAHVTQLAGIPTTNAFLAMSPATWQPKSRGAASVPTLALISVTDPATIEEVAQRVHEQVPASLVSTPFAQLQIYQSAPVTRGLTVIFLAAAVVTTLLTALSIVLVQLMGAPARGRMMAVLRTMGLGPRQGRALTAWELAPLLAMAFAVGALVGVGVPWMLLKAVNLSGVTGGDVQPALAFDPTTFGAVLLVLLLTVVGSVGVSAWVASRADLAQQLRIGDGR